MTQRRAKSETEIPLYLIPHVIARQIKERADDVFRISVKRTHWHHYNITVRTKPQNRELRVWREEVAASVYGSANNPDNKPGDDNSGGLA